MLRDPNTKSYMRLRYNFNFIDPDAKVQPRHLVDVFLTYWNTRVSGDVPPTESRELDDEFDSNDRQPNCYILSHRLIDVSDPVFRPLLEKLWPRATTGNPEYFQGLYNSIIAECRLWLLRMEHNELPYVSNLFTPKVNMPDDYNDLRIAFRHNPKVFILVRGPAFDSKVQKMVEDWKSLATYDPLSEFKVDPNQPYINNKSIKATVDCPRFTTPARYSFETFDEVRYFCGLTSLLEERFKNQNVTHAGVAAFIPVPNSFDYEAKLH